MTMTVANFQGRTSRPGASMRANRVCKWLLTLFAAGFTTSALAENILQDISFAPMAGDKVQVTMKFAGPVTDPQIFTTESPARIAIDVPDTRNGMAQR